MRNEAEWIGCEEALKRLAAFLDNELGATEAAEVEGHLERCRSCFSRADFERRLKERIREDLRATTVPDEMEQRVRALISRLRTT